MTSKEQPQFIFDTQGHLISRDSDSHIIIDGSVASGKSTFIKTLCEYCLYDSNLKFPFFMGLGRINISNDTALYFHEAYRPQHLFRAEIEKLKIVGKIIIVDSTQSSTFPEARSILERHRAFTPDFPIVVAVNKQDIANAMLAKSVQDAFNYHDSCPFIACTATDEASVKNVLQTLFAEIQKHSGI